MLGLEHGKRDHETRNTIMPIKPPPSRYQCPSCNWSKVVRPQSDALTPLDYFDECPKCGEKELLQERYEPNLLDNLKDIFKRN